MAQSKNKSAQSSKDSVNNRSIINKPDHYQGGSVWLKGVGQIPIQVVDVIEAYADKCAHRSQAIKYLLRSEKTKGSGAQDLGKVIWWVVRRLRQMDALDELLEVQDVVESAISDVRESLANDASQKGQSDSSL